LNVNLLKRQVHGEIPELSMNMQIQTTRIVPLMQRAAALVMLVGSVGAVAVPLSAQAAPSAHQAHSSCLNCGTVVSVHTYQRPAAHGSGLGIATGAVAGGLLGNQIGGGNGRTLATVAGAVGGGYAGNVVEKRMRSTTVTQVRVRMKNGSVRSFSEPAASRWYVGERVRVTNGALTARG
jgi:outer membrane lipoprotein SlyB